VKILFWLSLLGILYTYLGYPVAIWILSRLRPRPSQPAQIAPSVSIVLAVRNGLAQLPAKIQHLLTLDYPNIVEVVAVSDGSTDGTAEWLTRQQLPRFKAIALAEHSGKAVAVNAGVAQATGEILLFVDIRPEVAPGAIQHLVNHFADPQVGCVAGELILRHEGHDAASAAVGGLYWRYEQWIRKSEALFDSPVGVYGGFYAIRRALFVPQPAGVILDDMFEPLAIIRQGYRSVLDEDAVVYDTWPKKVSGEFHRKVRTLAGNFQLVRLAPWTITLQNRVLFQLVSHKFTRLLAPYLMLTLLVSALVLSTASPLYAAVAVAEIAFLALALLGLAVRIPLLHRIAAPASALLVLNAAAVVGLSKFLTTRGPLWKIWNANPTIAAQPTEAEDLAAPLPGQRGPEATIKTPPRGNPAEQAKKEPVMTYPKPLLLLLLGTAALLASFGAHGLAQAPAAQQAPAAAKPPAPPAFFPAGSIWTKDIRNAPVDRRSSTMINWLANAGGWGTGRLQVDFSIRLLQADETTPFVPFKPGPAFYAADSDKISTIPLPDGGGIEGQPGYECDIDQNDCHLLVVDRAHAKLYEAYQANSSGEALNANGIVVWDLNKIYPPSGRGDQCSSADAAGFPIAPLLFNADELAAGSINHAIRFTLPNPRIRAKVFVHPATHAGAPKGPESAPPYGAHFRLKATYNISKLKPAAQVVARAMQQYGMYISDGGNIALTAQNDLDTVTKYADVDFASRDLDTLRVTDFEILETGPVIPLTYDCVRNP
jgi:cellulose synthase/poly-beta-1,6-N-acetylglucosamine synthase-like glycosyltransferase